MQAYGIASFARGESLTTRQQNARYVARLVSDEIRFAQSVEIRNEVPGELASDIVYFSVDEEGSVLRTTKTEGTEVIAKSARDTRYSLAFNIVYDDEGDVLPGVTEIIVGAGPSEFKTSVLGLNLPDDGVSGASSGSVIAVRK